jgi:Amt family ammonium transporter
MIDSGDTAWMLTSTALVMLMLLPGLALFYGGLVRAKNLLSVMSQVLGIAAIAILTWVLWNYSLAFGDGNRLLGNFAKAGFAGIDASSAWPTSSDGEAIPELVFAAFQMSFAAITAALIVGALAERVRFSAMMLFAALWLTIVYAPLAHMVWASEGLLFRFGAIDFAGGTVVHVNAGSALAANGIAAVALVNSLVAPAAGLLAWMGAERLVSGKPSMLGGASGAVAGLVAVTPAAGAAGPVGALLLGLAASLACYAFVGWVKNRLRLDDSLDVFGIHGVGGIVGSIATAFVALPALGGHGGADYALGRQLVAQVAAVGVAICWSAAGSALCFALVRAVLPLRHARDAEREGLDIADHGERAYNY